MSLFESYLSVGLNELNHQLYKSIIDGYKICTEGYGSEVGILKDRIQSFDGKHWLPFNLKERCPECYEMSKGDSYDTPERMLAALYDDPYNIVRYIDDDTLDGIDDIDAFKEKIELSDVDAIVDAFNRDPDLLGRAYRLTQGRECPPSMVFEYNNTELNQWLVHNTDQKHVSGILNDGFKFGADDESIAYSGAGDAHGDGNYLFAFPIDDAPDPDSDGLKYGDNSIVFIGTGVNAYHNGDSEDQVIFDMNEPTSCFLVCKENYEDKKDYYNKVKEAKEELGDDFTEDDLNDIYADDADFWCVYGEKNGKSVILYKCNADEDDDAYRNCLEWIKQNGESYQKYMYHFKNRGRNTAQPSIFRSGNQDRLQPLPKSMNRHKILQGDRTLGR